MKNIFGLKLMELEKFNCMHVITNNQRAMKWNDFLDTVVRKYLLDFESYNEEKVERAYPMEVLKQTEPRKQSREFIEARQRDENVFESRGV